MIWCHCDVIAARCKVNDDIKSCHCQQKKLGNQVASFPGSRFREREHGNEARNQEDTRGRRFSI